VNIEGGVHFFCVIHVKQGSVSSHDGSSETLPKPRPGWRFAPEKTLTIIMRKFNKPPKLLPQEYSSFRPDVITYLVQNLPEHDTLLDPMAGTAPLLPFTDAQGRSAHFCDLLPIHFYLNSIKTIDVYKAYRRRKQRNRRFLNQLISSLLSPLASSAFSVSDGWLHNDIEGALCKAWRRSSRYSPEICKILRASLILSVRHFSSFSTSANTTWMKMGGICKVASIDSVAKEVAHRIERFYDQTYMHFSSSELANSSNCSIELGNAGILKLEKKRYILVTSPSYPNRYDSVQAYYPELYFLHRAALCPHPLTIKTQILASNKVDDFEMSQDLLSMVQSRSPSAFVFIEAARKNVPKDRVRKENDYYFRYYLRYYSDLFSCLNNIDQYTQPGSEYFLVVQTNIHRGEVNNIHDVLIEYFQSSGFESRIIKSWPRSHQGRRNISRHHPLVLKKHQESVVWARKVA